MTKYKKEIIIIEKSKVYFIKEITPESLIKIYDAMGVNWNYC